LIARPQQPFQRFVVALTTVVVAGLMILSLSRAVTLAAFLPLLIALVRLFVRGRVTAPVIVLTGLGLAATPWLLPPAWRLLESRFLEDTGSYEARLGALSDLTLGDVGLRLFLGGGDLILSTHTMIFDAALRGGLLAGLAAAVVVFVFFRHTGRALLAYFATAQVAALAATGAGCLVLVRAFTGGSGLLHLVEWSAFGLVLAAAILRSPGAPHPRAVPAQVPGSDPYPGTGPTAVPAREQANDAAPARS
jgi:hypothetical protein